MELITIDTYLYIGGRLRYLIQAKEGYPLYSLSHDAVLDNMKKLSHDIHTHQFKTTKSSKSFNDFNDLLREWENRPSDYRLDKYDVTELNKICKNIEEIIFSECKDKIVFKVLDKRIIPKNFFLIHQVCYLKKFMVNFLKLPNLISAKHASVLLLICQRQRHFIL